MIQRSPTWLQTVFSLKASILHVTWLRILILALFSIIITILDYFHDSIFKSIPSIELDILPISLFGFIITILLVFLNNAAFERWWEARKLWGSLVNTSRSFARQILTMIIPEEAGTNQVNNEIIENKRLELLNNIIGYVNSLRIHLRKEQYQLIDPSEELGKYLTNKEIEFLKSQHNIANKILIFMGLKISNLYQQHLVHSFHFMMLEESLKELTAIQGGCERIKYTPIPFPYKTLGNRLVLSYCLFLPFGTVGTLGLLTPIVVIFTSYALLGLAAIVDELEDPFGFEVNDLPLNAICRVIEINLRQMVDQEAPEYIYPDKMGILQ